MLPLYLSYCPNPLPFEEVSKAVCYASVCIGGAVGMNTLGSVRVGLIVFDFLLSDTEQFINTTIQFNLDIQKELETYFNGQKMHHDEIAKAVADIVEKSIGKAVQNIKITI